MTAAAGSGAPPIPWMDRLRMRTTLLIPLLMLSFGLTLLSLLIIRTIVERQIRADLSLDLRHSVETYRNLDRQRRDLLLRESSLLAELPTLKALMTAPDARTIRDAGADFWRISGSDFFALLGTDGQVVAAFGRQGVEMDGSLAAQMLQCTEEAPAPTLVSLGGRLYQVSAQALSFGDRSSGSPLGFVAVGYAIDETEARAVSEAAAAEVAFVAQGKVVASTLPAPLRQQLATVSTLDPEERTMRIGEEQYLVAGASLGSGGVGQQAPHLIVLKSIDRSMQLVHRVDRWVALLGLLALLVGVAVIVSISRGITHPLAVLVDGTRALGQGNFDYRLSEGGAEEVRELSRSFEHMRVEVLRTQKELLESERQATIGRMASSISHDLRHHLSAMYANAEFMCEAKLSGAEREELFTEVRAAIHGMTDLLDSLLLFTQTGRALHPELESLAFLMQRAVGLVRAHPAAREVAITLTGLSPLEAWVDGRKVGRAIYNLVLNGCQAAQRGTGARTVRLQLAEDAETVRIVVGDSGPGVPEEIGRTMFQPFVSEGKESGVGLGLTLARQIAEEHGGEIHYERRGGETLFTMIFPLSALQPPAPLPKVRAATPEHAGNLP